MSRRAIEFKHDMVADKIKYLLNTSLPISIVGEDHSPKCHLSINTIHIIDNDKNIYGFNGMVQTKDGIHFGSYSGEIKPGGGTIRVTFKFEQAMFGEKNKESKTLQESVDNGTPAHLVSTMG